MLKKEHCYPAIVADLGVERPAVKGQSIPVRNCWHFYTSGDSVEAMYRDEEDFIAGMNRILPVAEGYEVLILAFVLMDTHVHFVVYGEFDVCNRFIHEYVRRTSMCLSSKYPERKSLNGIRISHQVIADDRYLKTAICYVLKNPVAAGLPYNPWDYPWSSGPLYFRQADSWSSPVWMLGGEDSSFTRRNLKRLLKSHYQIDDSLPIISGVVFPGVYTDVDIVEKIFRTHKAFNYFMGISKEIDVESKEGVLSHLSIPISALREYRKQLSAELFGNRNLRELDVNQRVRLARALKGRYNSSLKQIIRTCGLVYDEVKGLI